ncbi:MAG TPA: tetratricopeptide repeat protein [Gemmataceae bacterium]|nr:tetratricopeptide repeat protein [Gemmataceae bacterium]
MALVLLILVAGLWWFHPWSRRTPAHVSAAEHWKAAQQAIQERDFTSARAHLTAYLASRPLSAEGHFLLAQTCRRDQDYAGWREHLARAEALQWPADAIKLERQLQQAQRGDVWAVEPALRAELQSDSDDEVLILEALVQGYLENERSVDAAKWTVWWSERHPDDWLAWLYHGRSRQQERSPEAINDYTRVLQVKPGYLPALLLRAAAEASTGRFEPALEDYRACLEKSPDDAYILFGIGHCEQSLGHPDAARVALDKALTLDPNNAAALLVRAKLELDNDPARALQWLLRAEKLAPNETDVVQNLTLAYRLLNQQDKAAAYDRRYQEIRTQAERLASLVTRIHQQPRRAELRYEAGQVCLQRGNDDEALHWFETALRIDPNHRPTHAALADYFAHHGDAQRAAYHRARAAEKPSKPQH